MFMRDSLLIVTAMLWLAVPALAQSTTPPVNTATACARFKMLIVEPGPAANLARTPERQPDANIEYKGRVIDPCAQPAVKAVQTSPRRLNKPKPLPLLKLNPEPENKLLSPAEMIKKLSQPAAPKPNP